MLRPILLLSASFLLAGCNATPSHQTKIYQTGEKAEHNKLTYHVVDVQIFPRLGEDPNARIPQHRFFVVQLSVSSSNNQPSNIPALALVDDAGKVYQELPDGSGIPRWMGVVRSIDPAQTESGQIIFDAPSAHYKLRLSDDTDSDGVYIDIPLNFMHEQMDNAVIATPDDGTAKKP